MSFIASRNPVVRSVGTVGTLALAIFDVLAVSTILPLEIAIAVVGGFFALFWAAAYVVVLVLLIRRTKRRWPTRGRHALAELIWDVALVQIPFLPVAVLSEIL